MPRFIPLPPPRNDEELLAQIALLERRRKWLQVEMLVLSIGAFVLAIAFGAVLLLP